MSISILVQKRAIVYEEYKIWEERARRLAFYGSSWLDHKGKSSVDLYPLPWEGKTAAAVMDKDTAEIAANELQKKLDQAGGDIKKLNEKGAGFKNLFG